MSMSSYDDILVLASKGLFEEAIKAAGEIEDPFEWADALLEIAFRAKDVRRDLVPLLLEEIRRTLKKIKDPGDRAYIYSKLARFHAVTGNGDEATEVFDRAAEEIARIKDEGERAIAMAVLAQNLALTGLTEEAIETFNEAFDAAISAEMDYRTKLDVITEIAGLIENAGDSLDSREAIRFYEMAYDIFDKLRISHRAADVEKKLKMARTLYYHGPPEVRAALLEGRYNYSLKLIEKLYKDPQERFIAMLEMASWLKQIGAPEYLDVLEGAFKLLERIGLSETNVQRAAAILSGMGELEKALRFAVEIKDPEKRDDALAAISLKLAERKDFLEAREVAKLIGNSMLKARLLEEIAKIEEESRWEI
ncbi:tetratricopeptide repeat protein [Thermococcus gammatolerans]|nr:tetratricopeptide repeat protein [Thermococcus gammatolerans]